MRKVSFKSKPLKESNLQKFDSFFIPCCKNNNNIQMKIKYLTFFVLVLLLFFTSVLLAQPKLKTKISREKTPQDTAFTLYSLDEYDQDGHLLRHEEPRYYCTQTIQYNKQGKPTIEEIMCGESDVNGTYYFDYQDNKTITTGDLGIYNFFRIEELYDKKGNKTSIQRWKNRIDEDSIYHIESFFYNEKNKIIRKEDYSLYFFRQGNLWEKNTESHTEITYTYTSFDSLQTVVFRDLVNKNSRNLEIYSYIGEGKNRLKEILYNYENGESRKVYSYDKDGIVIKERMESRKTEKHSWKPDSETKFIYRNKQLFQEIIESYGGKFVRSRIINSYDKNLLKSTKEYDKEGKIISEIVYEYTFFR
jgi:hypothetical protein